MKSVIEGLFNGEIDSFENFSQTDEYRKASKDVINQEEIFLKLLGQCENKAYEKLMNVKSHCTVIESKIHFAYGFKLGFCLANEMKDW